MIHLNNINFSYVKGKEIIKDFSYTFEKDNSYVICGDNGKGKTTLLKLLLGLLKPDSGEVKFDGDFSIGYVPDYNGLYDNLTMFENVIFRLGIYNKSYKEMEDRYIAWRDAYGLEAYEKTLVKALSLGTRKKVGLLCALLTMPQVLVLDEPTGGLDVTSREELINILTQLKKDMMIIAVTHDDQYIQKFQSVLVRM